MTTRNGLRASMPAAALAAALLAGCGKAPGMRKGADAADARVEIRGYLPDTQEGEVWFTQVPMQGMRIHGEVRGLLPGREYAMHIHEGGSCAHPDASGMHFDPAGSGRHGEPGVDPGQHHAGDLPNVRTDADGVATLDFTTNSLGAGVSDFSVVGRTLILHAGPDDYRSQPSGSPGAKLACGVIESVAGG